VINVPQNMK